MVIYLHLRSVGYLFPDWYLRVLAKRALRIVSAQRKCHYPSLERAIARLTPRPLLMIHGGADNYIKPPIARTLFEYAGEPREFWLVDKAKHNQAINVANGEYQRRVLAFFDKHLADPSVAPSGQSAAQPATPVPTSW
jgi:fermentation-respiration switch protein FrsA (DUF1100 family)